MMPFYGMLITAVIVSAMLLLPPTINLIENSQYLYSYFSRGYALNSFEADLGMLNSYHNCTGSSNLSGIDSFVVLHENQSCIISSAGLYWITPQKS